MEWRGQEEGQPQGLGLSWKSPSSRVGSAVSLSGNLSLGRGGGHCVWAGGAWWSQEGEAGGGEGVVRQMLPHWELGSTTDS